MTFQAKERPYNTKAEWEAAIKEAGSADALAVKLKVSDTTVRKWARAAGADTKAGGPLGQHLRTEAVLILGRMTDDELGAFVGLVGTDRACIILHTTKDTLRRHLRQRGVIPQVGELNPKASMLSQRVRRLERDDAAIRELARAIEHSAADAPSAAPLKRKPLKASPDRTPVDVILHASDLQYGELVHPEEVPGGDYSPDVFRDQRLPRYVSSVQSILRAVATSNPIGTVWVAQGGDFVEGENVFKGHHWHLAMDAGRQVDTLGMLWAQAVAEIAAEAKAAGAKRVACVSVVGNHGVHGGRSAGATPPSLSYDWLAYRSAALRLAAMPRNGDVDWIDEEPRKAVYFDAANNIVLMTHGDQDKGGGLIGVPVVTGMRNDLTVRLQTGVDHRYHICGHFHRKTAITIGGTRMRLWNQDWAGSTNLSVGRGGGGHPAQMVYVMHPEHGLHSSYIVNLADLDRDITHEIVR